MDLQRVLIVELLGGIGDLIFMIPALDAIKRTYPMASVDVLTFAPGGELLDGDPRVNEVYLARRSADNDPAATLRAQLAAVLDGKPYDLVVTDTRHSGVSDLIESTTAPRKVTRLWTGAGKDEPIARLFLRRLREEGVIGDASSSLPARLYPSPLEHRVAASLWSALGARPQQTVVLNPNAGVALKQWPGEHFVDLGQALAADGWSIAVLAGDSPDRAWTIARAIPEARFVPKLALRLTAACLAPTALVVSGDTGLAHLASAVGATVLAIFGPTWSGRYGVAEPSINLQSPFDCPELVPMNFTVQPCWRRDRCSFLEKTGCCEDVSPAVALRAARCVLGRRRA